MVAAKQNHKNAKLLSLLVSDVEAIKKLVAARKPVPKIGLKVVPSWCRQNPAEAAKRITALRDALWRTIAHCDAATHKTDAYHNEREAILDALRGPRLTLKRR